MDRESSIPRYTLQRSNLLRRLRRCEGQIRGIHNMVEEGRYCVDILVQIAAARSALNQVGLSLLDSHTRGCVKAALTEQSADGKIDELLQVVRQFTKP